MGEAVRDPLAGTEENAELVMQGGMNVEWRVMNGYTRAAT